jgi:hypothetical protein
MIKIRNTASRNILDICEEFYIDNQKLLIKRISNLAGHIWLAEFLADNLYKIITGTPEELIIINSFLNKSCAKRKISFSDLTVVLNSIFDYEAFRDDKRKAYKLATSLGVNVCPYCDRNYTVTVIAKSPKSFIVRPDFDHFFPQSDYPLLALSFYNLIPSCAICNRTIKRDQNIRYGDYIHPYEEDFGKEIAFSYSSSDPNSIIGIGKKLFVDFSYNSKDKEKVKRCKNSTRLFKLREIYQESHLQEISVIIRTYHISGGGYLEVLKNQFKGLATLEELYKIAFKNYINEEDFGNMPLGKLTRDIVDQMSFILPPMP